MKIAYVIEHSRATKSYPEEWVVWTAHMSEIIPTHVAAHISIVAMCPTGEAALAALRLLKS